MSGFMKTVLKTACTKIAGMFLGDRSDLTDFPKTCLLFHISLNELRQKMVKRCGRQEQGWRSCESARLPPMWPGFNSRTRRHIWVEFVVGSRPCSEGFSPGSPVFLPLQKLTLQIPIRRG